MSVPSAFPACWVDSAAITDVGLVRSNNEDNVRLLPCATHGIALALLADGMGGHASGEVASAMALESIMESYQQRPTGQALTDAIQIAIEQANEAVWHHSQGHPETSGMGTTVCAMALDAQGIFFGWIGDSRIYRLRDGQLQQLTRDDTLVNHLLDDGILTPEQAETHPDAHVLSQALGTHAALQKVNVLALEDTAQLGDVFLLTSDGIHDVLPAEAMALLLQDENVHQAAQDLVKQAKDAGSTDNLSAIVLRLTHPKDVQAPLAATRY